MSQSNGESVGMMPLGLVSQVENTLTTRLSITEAPRNAVILQSQRQTLTHQGTFSCTDTIDTLSFHICSCNIKRKCFMNNKTVVCGVKWFIHNFDTVDKMHLFTVGSISDVKRYVVYIIERSA